MTQAATPTPPSIASAEYTSSSRVASRSTAWVALIALFFAHFAVDCCFGIWPVYKTIANLDMAKAGMIATAGSLIGNGLQIFFGLAADRGFRKILLIAGLLLCGSVTLVPHTDSYFVLFLLVSTSYLGSAAFHPSATGGASSMSHSRKGLFVAFFLAGGYLGYAISQALFIAIYSASPKSTGLLILLPLIALALVVTFVREKKTAFEPFSKWHVATRAQLQPLFMLFAVQVFAGTVNMALVFLLPDLLISLRAESWVAQGGAHFALVLGGCLSLLPAGIISDRFSARSVLVVANAIAGLLLVVLLTAKHGTWTTLVILAAFGGFNGANNVVTVAEANRLLPGQASGVSALLMGAPWCIAALAPMIVASLADPTKGGSPATALGWMTICVPIVLLISARLSPKTSVGHRSEKAKSSKRQG